MHKKATQQAIKRKKLSDRSNEESNNLNVTANNSSAGGPSKAQVNLGTNLARVWTPWPAPTAPPGGGASYNITTLNTSNDSLGSQNTFARIEQLQQLTRDAQNRAGFIQTELDVVQKQLDLEKHRRGELERQLESKAAEEREIERIVDYSLEIGRTNLLKAMNRVKAEEERNSTLQQYTRYLLDTYCPQSEKEAFNRMLAELTPSEYSEATGEASPRPPPGLNIATSPLVATASASATKQASPGRSNRASPVPIRPPPSSPPQAKKAKRQSLERTNTSVRDAVANVSIVRTNSGLLANGPRSGRSHATVLEEFAKNSSSSSVPPPITASNTVTIRQSQESFPPAAASPSLNSSQSPKPVIADCVVPNINAPNVSITIAGVPAPKTPTVAVSSSFASSTNSSVNRSGSVEAVEEKPAPRSRGRPKRPNAKASASSKAKSANYTSTSSVDSSVSMPLSQNSSSSVAEPKIHLSITPPTTFGGFTLQAATNPVLTPTTLSSFPGLSLSFSPATSFSAPIEPSDMTDDLNDTNAMNVDPNPAAVVPPVGITDMSSLLCVEALELDIDSSMQAYLDSCSTPQKASQVRGMGASSLTPKRLIPGLLSPIPPFSAPFDPVLSGDSTPPRPIRHGMPKLSPSALSTPIQQGNSSLALNLISNLASPSINHIALFNAPPASLQSPTSTLMAPTPELLFPQLLGAPADVPEEIVSTTATAASITAPISADEPAPKDKPEPKAKGGKKSKKRATTPTANSKRQQTRSSALSSSALRHAKRMVTFDPEPELFASNLPENVTKEELRAFFSHVEVTNFVQGLSGTGFISADLMLALRQNGHMFRGKPIALEQIKTPAARAN